jgi:hypothetical protein
MPSVIKRKTSHVAPSTFTVYAGDDPRPGGYRGVIKQVDIVKSKGDNLMLRPVIELKAQAGSEKAKYDGYPVFPNIVLTDTEANVQREQAFYMAVCGKQDADITADGTPEKFKAGDGQKCKVTKIGGVNPVGKVVNVRLTMSAASDEYPSRLECNMVFAASDGGSIPVETDDVDDIEGDVEDADEYEEDDLLKLGLPALRKILVEEFGVAKEDAAALKKKADLVSEILEAQAGDDEEEDDEEAEEEEAEDDEEDEDEDEEDDEEEDKEAELREEFGAFNRVQLKAEISKRKPDFKFLKSHTDEALLEKAVELALEDPPF